MYSGIINYTGTIDRIARTAAGTTLTVRAPRALVRRLAPGASVGVNGVCLTVIGKTMRGAHGTFRTFLMNETIRRTSFAHSTAGDTVNVEPSLRLGDEISGHFVFGHVDAVGTITKLAQDGGAVIMSVRIPRALKKFFPPKGSVALDGISLTVIAPPRGAGADTVSVSLIPYTVQHTNLKQKKQGALLNVEVDMLARYALQQKRTARA